MSANKDILDEFERLVLLRRKGAITAQEYLQEKRQFLDRLNGPEAIATAEASSRPSVRKIRAQNDQPAELPKRRWYSHGWGLVAAVLLFPSFAIYWLLIRKDDSDEWYMGGIGAAVALIFVPLFALWYIWTHKSDWGIGKKSLTSVGVVIYAIILMSMSSTNATPTSEKSTAVDLPITTAAAALDTPETEEKTYAVSKVVDGDTIYATIDGKDESIRLIGIDTPETKDPRKPVQCFGEEASAKMAELVKGKSVRLEADKTQADRDTYDRFLRYVYLEDGTFINLELIKLGFAHEYTYEIPYEFQADFKEAQTAAKAGSLGLWSPTTCNGTENKAAAPTFAPAAVPTAPSAARIVTPQTPAPTVEAPAPTQAPVPESVYYANCTAAKAAGVAPIYIGEPGYRSALDRDSDGIACET